MKTASGIPYRNIINSRVVLMNERVLRIFYCEQQVIIIADGWENYHVIIEDGHTQETDYRTMTAEEVQRNFNIDITQLKDEHSTGSTYVQAKTDQV